jgi:hypothetical protein
MKKLALALALVALAMTAAACSSDKATTTPPSTKAGETPTTTTVAVTTTAAAPTKKSGVIAVPADKKTIQAAVDSAKPGDLILISPGVYNEAVDVTTDNLTLRGLDRNTVILDGQFKLDNGIRVVATKGVAIENMTARNYAKNGFFWTGAEGYRGSYLTTYRTGDYGVYAFDSVKGQIDNSYMSGSPDAGVYVGECYPCDAAIDKVVSEYNGLGYSGTNSGGNLLIVNSTFRFNRAGVVPNSGTYELCYPERNTTFVGNTVYSNNQPDTPAIDVAILAMGNGILSAGGVRNVIERNLVYDHDKTGIGLVPFLEEDPNDEVPPRAKWDTPCAVQKNLKPNDPGTAILFDSMDNKVTGNVVSGNRAADLAVASAGGDISTFGNCWSGNTFGTSAPAAVETLAPCGGAVAKTGWDVGTLDVVQWLVEKASRPKAVPYETAPTPEPKPQQNMPDAATTPAHPATDVPFKVDLAAIKVPAKPA